MAVELLLIRHGESEANAGISHDPNCALTPRGIEQARELGARLADEPDVRELRALVSPYRRAVQTAAEIAGCTGLGFAIEELVREWGELALIEKREYPKETAGELVARMGTFVGKYANQRLIVVSHAVPIAVLCGLAAGQIPDMGGQFWAGVGNCCSIRIRIGG